jgi:predicted metal-dependent phosphoesterase TrpH
VEFDLHIHSKYSFDTKSAPDKIIEIAKKRGLKGIAITDHGTIKGGIEGVKLSTTNDFFVICGAEIETEYGDIIGLFLEKEIKSRFALEVIDEIKEQGGIAVLPHPYKRVKQVDEKILTKIDAIEVFNARGEQPSFCSRNELAVNLARDRGIPVVAGSDAHFYFEIGRGRCVINGISSAADIKEAILKGETRIIGVESSLYVEPLSQLVKMIKMRRLELIGKVSFQTLYITAFILKKRLLNTYRVL